MAALLFLEAKALGWYRANCAAYLYFLAQRLTAAVAAHPIELTIHQLADSSSSSAMRGANNSYGHVNKLVNIINDEVSKLQAVLFSIPEMDLGEHVAVMTSSEVCMLRWCFLNSYRHSRSS